MRLRLVREKGEMQEAYDALLVEKRNLEKAQIDSEAERLRIAKVCAAGGHGVSRCATGVTGCNGV